MAIDERKKKKLIGQRVGETLREGLVTGARRTKEGLAAATRVIGEPQEQVEQFYKAAFGSPDYQTTREFEEGLKPLGDTGRPASLLEIPTERPAIMKPAISAVARPVTAPTVPTVEGYAPKDRRIDERMLRDLMALNEEAAQWSGNIGDPGEAAYRNPNRQLMKQLLSNQQKERMRGTFGDVARKESAFGIQQRQQQLASAGLSQAQRDAVAQESKSQAEFERMFMGGTAATKKKKAALEERRREAAFTIM